jgi:hypothetical protein
VSSDTGNAFRDRLKLADALLEVAEGSVATLQRLLTEVHREVGTALREEAASVHEDRTETLTREIEQLRDSIASRAVIERAKGRLMQAHGLSDQEAFDLMTQLSQRQRRKLRDVAVDLATATSEQVNTLVAGPVLVAVDGAAAVPSSRRATH